MKPKIKKLINERVKEAKEGKVLTTEELKDQLFNKSDSSGFPKYKKVDVKQIMNSPKGTSE